MLSYNELKIGARFVKDGEPYEVLEYSFVRMQQRKPVAQLKIKNLISGKVLPYTAHQKENFEEAEIEQTPVQFIYHNRGEYWFHEIGKPANRFSLKDDIIGDAGGYLKQNSEVRAFKFGDKIINIEPPIKVELKVTEAPPAVRGNTAQGGTKTAVLETGAKVNVPLFINTGDVIRVNTKTGEYTERADKA
jgi:elongation factor P